MNLVITTVLNIFFMRELSARVSLSSPLVVNAVNPGLCKTELAREMRQSRVFNIAINIMMGILARTAEQGGSVVVHAATSTKPESMVGKKPSPKMVADLDKEGAKAAHGKFFHTCRITEESDFVISEEGGEAQKRLWVSMPSQYSLILITLLTKYRMKLWKSSLL